VYSSRQGGLLIVREDSSLGRQLVQKFTDNRCIAINVGTVLQHWSLSITTRKRNQIWFWHYDRNLDQGMALLFVTEEAPYFFREGRRGVLMQYYLSHDQDLQIRAFQTNIFSGKQEQTRRRLKRTIEEGGNVSTAGLASLQGRGEVNNSL